MSLLRQRLDDQVKARRERFRERGGVEPADAEGKALLEALLASGSFLPDILLADTALLGTLLADPWLRRPKPPEVAAAEVRAETAAAVDQPALERALRRVRQREMLRLGARELGWGTTEEVARELSALADACLEAAVVFTDAELAREHGAPVDDAGRPLSFVVLAMGKLGGEELNFCSDVDLVYFYSSDGGAAGGLTPHEYYAKLSQRVTAALEDVTEDGFVFRVDLRLRPEGRSGPICNSFAAAERYYETFGRTWERQALLRARPAAGDRALGREILRALEPFTYPRSIDPGAVEEVRALRRLYQPRGGDGGFDVKLGTGGIRDIELCAQTLQLMHAGKRPELRERSTPRALRRLWAAGLLSDRETRVLSDAYAIWRRIEHHLQLEHGAQTHTLTDDSDARVRMASRLGLSDVDSLARVIDGHRQEVGAVVATFGDHEGASEPRPELGRLLDPVGSRERIQADLRALGFRDGDAGADLIEQARTHLSPAVIDEAAGSPDPDRALARFADLLLRGSAGVRALLDAHPRLVRMLATLFGASDHLARLLVTHPDMWEPFLGSLGQAHRSPDDMRRALADRVRDLPEDETLHEMRRFQAEETLRIGLHDVSGSLEPAEVSVELAGLAEACIGTALALCESVLAPRYGKPAAELTVLALGSLGAREIRYGSDLDLVFLYSRDGVTDRGVEHREWYGRLAQRLIGALGALLETGRLYQVDTRLRPSGEQGMLVTSQDAFALYHRREAATWERVALLRGRVLDGDGGSAREAAAVRFGAVLQEIVYGRPIDRAALAAELVRVRRRIERERAKTEAGVRHLRFDAGGLTDVEFLAAFGQLSSGAEDLALRTTSVESAVARLADRERGETGGGDAVDLVDDHRFLRRVALRLRLLRDHGQDAVTPDDVPPLARTLGLDPGDLDAELKRRMGRIRRRFEAILGS